MNVISTTPSQKAVNVNLLEEIKILFDVDIDVTSIDDASITVTTKKANILTPGTTGVNIDIYKNDSFFNPEFTGIHNGQILIDPLNSKQLIFKPSFRYMPNSEYSVYISATIAGTDSSLLATVKTLSFKTSELDTSEALPATPGSVIIGHEIAYPEPGQSTSPFRILSSTPKMNSFLNVGKSIKIVFNKPVKAGTNNAITVSSVGIFSDEPAVTLEQTSVINGAEIVITLAEVPDINSVISIELTGIQSVDSENLEQFEISFVSQLTPYNTSTKMIKLKAGSVLTGIADITLAMMILWVSQEATIKLARLSLIPNGEALKSKWVLYTAIERLLLNNAQNPIADSVKKTLAEYSISITNGSKVKLYNQLLGEVKQFQKSFDAYLNFRFGGNVSKGSAYPVKAGRTWNFDATQPGLNSRDRFTTEKIWDELGHPVNPLIN